VKILAWNFNCSQQVYYNRLTVGSGISHDNILDLPCQYNFNDYFVSFQVRMIYIMQYLYLIDMYEILIDRLID
jgi:hypothetical protein